MAWVNSRTQYGRVAKWLHWIIAILVITMLLGVFYLDYIPKSAKPMVIMLHKSTGILVLFLVIFRLVWALSQIKPSLPASVPKWQKKIARSIHGLLYVGLFIMPLSGWIMATAANKFPVFYGLFSWPFPFIQSNKGLARQLFQVHQLTAWILLTLVSLHILAALKHHFINKDNVMKSML